MAIVEAFIGEMTQEAKTTRRVLERVPDAQLTWKPHPKSMSLGQLAFHLATVPRGVSDLLNQPEAEPRPVPLRDDVPVAEMLELLDRNVEYALARLGSWGDAGLGEPWRMTREGKTIMEMPRVAAVRAVLLNHWYHHRGQMTVYLRLLDVPLPSVYGPSADDRPF